MRHATLSIRMIAGALVLLTVDRAAGDDPSPTPKVGAPAPPLRLKKLLQAPEGASTDWESLKGKVVVVEFWATWCGPCVAMIPFYDKLQAQFEDEPVVFISITDEDEPAVERFLKKTTMRGWIGLDTDTSTFKSYRIRRRPSGILIDRNGMFAGWASPSTLVRNPEILRDLLAGKSPSGVAHSPPSDPPDVLADVKSDIEADLGGGNRGSGADRPSCLILIRPAKERTERDKRTPAMNTARKFRYQGYTLRNIISQLYDVADPHILTTSSLRGDKKYDIAVDWPWGPGGLGRELLKQSIEGTFKLRIQRVMREMDVYILGVPDGKVPALEPRMQGLVFDAATGNYAPTQEILDRVNAGEKFFMAIGDTGSLAPHVAYALDKPVIDEAKIDGYYHFVFPYDYDKPDHKLVLNTIKDKFGLTLAPAKREVEVLLVEDSETPD